MDLPTSGAGELLRQVRAPGGPGPVLAAAAAAAAGGRRGPAGPLPLGQGEQPGRGGRQEGGAAQVHGGGRNPVTLGRGRRKKKTHLNLSIGVLVKMVWLSLQSKKYQNPDGTFKLASVTN